MAMAERVVQLGISIKRMGDRSGRLLPTMSVIVRASIEIAPINQM